MLENLTVFLFCYLLGSIPTALIVSHQRFGVDIRELGDGNMGARNTYRNLGHRLGVIVALTDALKGVFSVLLAKQLGLDLQLQCVAGAAAILGHDFPIFAHFRGGQGLATTIGSMFVLFPEIASIGLIVYAVLYLTTRNSDLSASTGLGLMAFLLWKTDQPMILLVYTVATLLVIPAKKMLDSNRIYKEKQIPEQNPPC
jgi:glycerol-3-phosphate acyltransferase PlsY